MRFFDVILLSLLLTTFSLGGLSLSAHASPSFIPDPPSIAAKSYILMDATTGQIIVDENADQQLPPASLTKIMTSYVTAHELQEGNVSLEDDVLISIKAWKKGGSKMYIREGSRVKLKDLIKGVIVQSGNDASIAVAEHIAGSEEAFADLMNLHADDLGMTKSNFHNATGWPADGHLTTTHDLARLTQALISRFPDHYAHYKQKEFTYNDIKQPNRNLLLWRDSSVDGVKTGHTEEAGYCLISSAVRDNMRLIAVVMGTKSPEARATQSLKLLNYGFRFYNTHTAYLPNTEIHSAEIWSGAQDTLSLGLSEEAILTIPRGQEKALKALVDLKPITKAPISAGEELGTVKLVIGEETILEKPLVALQSVEQGGLFKRFWHWLRLLFTSLFSDIDIPKELEPAEAE